MQPFKGCLEDAMNVGRIVAAGVAATVWDAAYGFLVYGMLLTPEFARYPAVFRSKRFGLLIAVFVVCIFTGVNYATLNIGGRITVTLACAGLVEWFVAGVVIGAVYKGPARSPR